MLYVLGAAEKEGQSDSRPSEIPITGVRYFGKSSRIGGKPVVIADLSTVLTRGIARVFLRVVYGLLGPHSNLPLKRKNSSIFATISLEQLFH